MKTKDQIVLEYGYIDWGTFTSSINEYGIDSTVLTKIVDEIADQFKSQQSVITEEELIEIREILQRYEIYKAVNYPGDSGVTYEEMIDNYLR